MTTSWPEAAAVTAHGSARAAPGKAVRVERQDTGAEMTGLEREDLFTIRALVDQLLGTRAARVRKRFGDRYHSLLITLGHAFDRFGGAASRWF